MTTPLTQMPKPEAEQYSGKRKIFLVPNFMIGPEGPDEFLQLLDGYWSEIRDHINNLERSLGTITHVYHEMVSESSDEGMKFVEMFNPKGCSFIRTLCNSGAQLEATENNALLAENSDWQRCMSMGLASEKVRKIALDGYNETTNLRWDHISACLDKTLKQGETGVIFIREGHRIQFPEDIQVFYVAPPSLDGLKRWLSAQMRPPTTVDENTSESEEPSESSEEESAGKDELSKNDE